MSGPPPCLPQEVTRQPVQLPMPSSTCQWHMRGGMQCPPAGGDALPESQARLSGGFRPAYPAWRAPHKCDGGSFERPIQQAAHELRHRPRAAFTRPPPRLSQPDARPLAQAGACKRLAAPLALPGS